ncbi:MAG: glycosyltransferase family 2 protein [Candidatus Cloacimonadota bacterium]|nr:glycosyltransferase family 2 protein [Candidatus Cloacimonadota bacterium]
MKISFVIPVYNEEDSLKLLYSEILEHTPTSDFEIIFVDDGSNDGSFKVMNTLATNDKRLKIIKFRKNFGKSAALKVGFENTSGDIIFTMDADLQDNPAEIPNFIEKIKEGYDLVSGWKKKRKDPLNKTLPSKIFNVFNSKAFRIKLHDFNCGFKAYRAELVNELDLYGEMHRYIPALAQAKGFKIAEIPVEHRQRKFGKSKYGIERYLRGFLDFLTVKLVTSYTHSPLYLFGRIGTFIGGVGFLIGLYLTIMKYFFHQPLYNRPLLFLAILLIMIGLQFFSIGLLAELIVSQNRRKNNEQKISIEKMVNIKERGK